MNYTSQTKPESNAIDMWHDSINYNIGELMIIIDVLNI